MGLVKWIENKNARREEELRQEGRLEDNERTQAWYRHEKENGSKFETPPPGPDDPKR